MPLKVPDTPYIEGNHTLELSVHTRGAAANRRNPRMATGPNHGTAGNLLRVRRSGIPTLVLPTPRPTCAAHVRRGIGETGRPASARRSDSRRHASSYGRSGHLRPRPHTLP